MGPGKLKALWPRRNFLPLSEVSKLTSGRYTEIHRLNFFGEEPKENTRNVKITTDIWNDGKLFTALNSVRFFEE